MYKILVDGHWIEGAPVNGDRVRYYDSGGGYREYVYSDKTPEDIARVWRDEELSITDWIVPVTDHPKHALALSYRAELRDWPSTASFPSTRPISPL